MKGSNLPRLTLRCLGLRKLALLLLMASYGTGSAQSLEQFTSWGDASMARGEYYGASRFYAGALDIDGGRMSLQWKQAEASRLSNQYDKAAELYAIVYRKDAGRTYTDALAHLGEMQLCNATYDEAEKTWAKVLQKEKDQNSVRAQRARNAIAGCAIARAAMASPGAIELEHIQQPMNSTDSEFGARLGPDSMLYFTSLRGELNKDGEVVDTTTYLPSLFRSTSKGTSYETPQALSTANSSGSTANSTWTLNGKWILFTHCPSVGPCRIHYAPAGGTDLMATPLPGLGDELSTQPMVVEWEGREMLLFVSDRPGGQGGMDIWSARLENGTAVELSPLGAAVNTAGNERSPWYDAASSTLWFSSDFHPGMGGYDIFTSEFRNDVFQAPVHAGTPLNSPANDLYPAFYPERNEGWITSNRVGSFAEKGQTCCNDLYRFRLPADMVAKVKEDEDEEISSTTSAVQKSLLSLQTLGLRLPLKLYFHNDQPEPRSWSTTSEQDYGTTYRRYRDLIPTYLKESNAAAVDSFFRNDVDRGYLELAELVIALRDALNAGVSITLDVRGHASPLAANDYNVNLSKRRIETLRHHLRMVHNGDLRRYLDGSAENRAVLSLNPLPFGEENSAEGVSDDLADLKRSVYAIAAAKERRIEIQAIRPLATAQASTIEEQRQDLGRLRQDEEREVVFMVQNTGTGPMRFLDSKADCGCTAAELPVGDIAPGESVPVTIHFNGRAPLGGLVRKVTLRTNGTPEIIDLSIEGEIVP